MTKYIVQTEKEEVKTWINSVLGNYLRKKGNVENISEIEHIIDYLNSESAPTRLKKMSYIQAQSNASKWNKAQIKKGKHIKELKNTDFKVIKQWKDGFSFVQLISENSFKKEGHLMGHCVASYYTKTEAFIYSLRDAKNNPHCTIEVLKNKKEVCQIKGKGNGHIHPDYIKKILVILKYFKMTVRDSELENLGYSYLDTDSVTYLKKNYKPAFLIFNKKEYIYNYEKL